MKTRNEKICKYRAMKGMTLEKIGKKFGITREAVRQIIENNREKCSKEIRDKINLKKVHQYHPPRNILSLEKELQRKKWIYQYAKNGTSIKEIAEIFYSLSIKRIKEIIEEMTPELRKCKFCGKEFTAIGEEKRSICPECLRKFLLFENDSWNYWRYASIMRYRFGLDNGITRTLEETGKEFGVTRERIRQIEAKSLEIIKECDYLTTNIKGV